MFDDFLLFLRGVMIGFAIAVPIGPVGILCLRRALNEGRLAAWLAGFGAAIADGCFGAAVVIGAATVSHFLHDYTTPLKLFGGVFMLILGIRAWRMVSFSLPATEDRPRPSALSLLKDFSTTFLITITNPGTMLGVAGTFAALGPVEPLTAPSPMGAMISGVLVGSLLWWGILTELAMMVRHRVTASSMRRFNRISAALLLLFAVVAWASLLFDFS